MAKFLPLTGLVCGVVGLLLYINTLGCDFCFDDKVAILQNKDLLPTSPWTNILWNDFWGHPIHLNISHKSYRPLCVATFRLNYMLHGLDPMGYHLVNVLLHAVVCYLYVQLCGVIFIEVWPALIAGLFFAVHPIHTEAVSEHMLIFYSNSIARMYLGGWDCGKSRPHVCNLLSPLSIMLPSSLEKGG